ncbi:MAG: ATP-binding cassette domain-containing protein [Oscillospiraceae bacterium]|nr:ATP-binding cassette domain-containing protein [Oscillospiraceae bacterium]
MNDLLHTPLGRLWDKSPFVADFFAETELAAPDKALTFAEYVQRMDQFQFADCGMSAEQLMEYFTAYIQRLEAIGRKENKEIKSLTILGGRGKSGCPELSEFTVRSGEIACVVGPTGSGKSRLLEDIEYLAQGDTPTGRRILLNGSEPEPHMRWAAEDKPVAQLSQNMNFIMDLSVRDFLMQHAESRLLPENTRQSLVQNVIACANTLTGEPFSDGALITTLSGGQSRALMIADTAILSASPIVLIDEIENAGVDRVLALNMLVKKDKLVFAATHDPLIAMAGTKRIVLNNGGIQRVISPEKAERDNISCLSSIDQKLMRLRALVRAGRQIDFNLEEYFSPQKTDIENFSIYFNEKGEEK